MKMVRFAHEISLFAYFYVEDHFRFSHFRGYAAIVRATGTCFMHRVGQFRSRGSRELRQRRDLLRGLLR